MPSPTGEQFEISRTTANGTTRAVITQVGAAVRILTVDGLDLTEPYGDDIPTPYANGVIAVPWPNRVDDGMWVLDGVQQHLDISEVRYNNAVHGLLRFTPYHLEDWQDSAVTLGATIYPQNGYPYLLETTVAYAIDERGGLRVTHGVTNVGTHKAPVALGASPYLRVGDTPQGQLYLEVSGRTRFESTQRLIPFVEMPVEGTEHDLRVGRVLANLRIDNAYGEVGHIGGIARHSIEAPDGRRVVLWQDENFGFVHVYTTRSYPRQGSGPSLGIALSPMTAPPNALVTKRSLRWLVPGETWNASWGIYYDKGPFVA